jgi:hypothetical protein
MAKPKTRTPSPEDVARLGQSLANLKAKTNPKDWARFVKAAHARGVTVAGATSGAPEPLQERLRSSLKTQAQKTVTASYAPDLAELDKGDVRVRNLDTKRSADNQAYQQWLMQQQATYAGAATAANDKYAGYLDKLKADTADRYATAQTGAQQAAQAAPGTVSDMSQSTALKGLEADKARAVGQVDNARLQTAALIPGVQQTQEASRQSLLASGAQREADRMNATGKALTDLGDNRFKLLAGRAADTVKEYTRLLDQQIDVANSNRDFGAAAEKLGVQRDTLVNTIKQQNRDYGLKKANLTLAQLKAQNTQAYQDAQIKLGYDQIVAAQGKSEADRQLKLYLNKHPPKTAAKPGTTDTSKRYSTDRYIQVNNVLSTLSDLHKSHPAGKVSPDGRPMGFREYLRSKGASNDAIDVAEDLRTHGGKLSAAGRAKARKMGILNPESLWGTA